MSRLAPEYVRAQIALLRSTHPEIWDHDDDDALIADTIEGETQLPELFTRLTERLLVAEHHADGIPQLIENMRKRQARLEHRAELLRRLMLTLMSEAGLKTHETPLATLSIRPGKAKVIITDESALPERMFRVKREPDKKAIREYLEHGSVGLAGATLSNVEPVLQVRMK